jgi:transcriptional regulator with XRE-family HTH domain
MPSITETIALNVKSFRTKSGLTQARLAEAAGVGQTHIADIETGKKTPSVELLENIARVLEVAPWELLLSEALEHHVRKGVGAAMDSFFRT